MIKEGGVQMRICRKDIYLVKPGEIPKPAEKRKKEPKKRKGTPYNDLSQAHRRKVDELRRKATESNQAGRVFKNVEMR